MHRSVAAVFLGLAVGGVCLSAQTPVSFPASGPPQSPSATPASPATAALIGIVADEASNKPISGAIVSILASQGASPSPSGRNNVLVITGPDGRFLFSGLTQGLYVINASKNGYLPAASGSTTGANPLLVDLAEGQMRTDMRIAMARPGAISGTVLDEAGEPVIGVQVLVARRIRARGRTTWQPVGGSVGSTDDRGVFRAGNLPPGDYIVMADQSNTNLPTAMIDAYQKAQETTRPGQSNPFAEEMMAAGGMGIAPGSSNARLVNSQVQPLSRSTANWPDAGGRMFVYPPLFYPAASTLSKATIVTLRSGEDRPGIDMALRPVRAVSIGGTVSAPDGPMAFTAVTLTDPDSIESPFNSGRIGTTTDATGAFTFLGVPSGEYVLRVTKIPTVQTTSNMVSNTITRADGSISTMTSTSGPSTAGPLPPDPTLWAEVPISAGAKDIVGLSVNLQSGARLSGRIEFSGAATRPTPQLMAGLGLSLQPITGASRSFRSPRARVDEQGQITTQGYPAGQYNISLIGVPPPWTLLSMTSKNIDVSQRPLEIGASDISDLVVTFTDRITELTGTVTAQDGSVPKAAAVFLFPSDEPLVHDYGINSRRVLATRASANGRYTFMGFPAGDYRVVAIEDVAKLADLSGEFVQTLVPTSESQHFTAGDKRQQNLTVVRIK